MRIEREALRAGDVFASSHGFDVFVHRVETVEDTTAVHGTMHRADGPPHVERYPSTGVVEAMPRTAEILTHLEQQLDHAVSALGNMPHARRKSFAQVGLEARVQELATEVAWIREGLRAGYARALGRSTRRVWGVEGLYLGAIAGAAQRGDPRRERARAEA